MGEPRIVNSCKACGVELTEELATGGLCPGCLIDLALSPPGPSSEDEPAEESETLVYEADTLAEGQVLGSRYRIEALLGRGGMGEVWRAVDLKLRVEIALKALRGTLLSDERALETLRQEVRVAREVASPNVCRVFDLVELDGQELVSMEYIDGVTLLDILRARAPLSLAEAQEIASQFLAGLEAIHEAGLVHRDVKPENLMMTRSGRVVLMDFGIAKGLAESATGTVSGTPAYMAPEQGRGEAPDARVDVFSAGVVLAEMIAPGGIPSFEAREAIWRGVHTEPIEVPDSPWSPVLRKAVARSPEHRFPSAAALERALEEVTLRIERAEDAHPYPGLASFSQENAEYFFGRELEIEEMWKKLERPHLLGLIGPSGAGKSSFLRAGLLAVMPTGWRAVVATPGTQPFLALARVLASELAGDETAVQDLLEFEDPDVAVSLVSRWRSRHDHVLIVLDQFEELFTQSSPDVQERFSDLLARIALEVDAHILLAMRDDFLFHSSSQPALSPMFSELTPLRPPSGTALRRALVQPALKCGYRFEDESLVDEMLAEVGAERGALPMLAFAAARLWDHRDKDEGLLTREAYEHIGGVGGALAQHAEATLERIGQSQIPLVRELFRNLITSQGTRAARTRPELLSVFDQERDPSEARDRVPPSADAAAVLDTLIDARLLTSYELPSADEEGAPEQRVEIIHESLLANWPRLVHWQAQDQEGALLRDQLRQAAQMWEERGHPEDLLWTGTSFDEYKLWRERYSGGLSTSEEAFSRAMTVKAERRTRQRRRAVVGAFALLIAVLAVVGSFWRGAVAASNRAEAQQLLALGRLEIDNDPTAALAYALASLEHADEPETRVFALEALWRGPMAVIPESTPTNPLFATTVDFSNDGRWLATGTDDGSLKLWQSSGGEPLLLDKRADDLFHVRFGPDSRLLVVRTWPSHEVQIRSIPDGHALRTLASQAPADFRLAQNPSRIFTFTDRESRTDIEAWPLGGGPPESYGELDSDVVAKLGSRPFPLYLALDPAGNRLALVLERDTDATKHSSLHQVDLARLPGGEPQLIERVLESFPRAAYSSDGKQLASADTWGTVRVWDLDRGFTAPRLILGHTPSNVFSLIFDAAGSRLAAALIGLATVWDLDGPPDAEPMVLRRRSSRGIWDASFHPNSEWLATAGDRASLWPIRRQFPRDLKGHERSVSQMAFLPDGKWLVSVSQDTTVRLWPLSASSAKTSQVLFKSDEWLDQIAVGPRGRRVLVGGGGSVWVVPVTGDATQRLEGSSRGKVRSLALSEQLAVAGFTGESGSGSLIRVWNLDTGAHQDIAMEASYSQLELTPDERLILAGDDIRVLDLTDGSSKRVSEEPGRIGLSRSGKLLLAGGQSAGGEAGLYDLATGGSVPLISHGQAQEVGLVAAGTIVMTSNGAADGLRVGLATGEAPHLLVAKKPLFNPVISPNGQWIAAIPSEDDHAIRLWPVPDLSQKPLHTLPYAELLAKLRSLTNLRVVEDPDSETGWSWALDPFPGWEEVPTW